MGHKTLGIHNSANLWNYVYIFIENMSAHYGQIQPFIGSRTRTNRQATNRRESRSRDEQKDLKLTFRSSPLIESQCYLKPADILRYSSPPSARSAKTSSGSSAISSYPNIYRYHSGSSEGLQMQDLKLLSDVSSKRIKSGAHSACHPSTSSKSFRNGKGNVRRPNNRHRKGNRRRV